MKTDKEIIEELNKENEQLKLQNQYLKEDLNNAHKFRDALYTEWSECATRAWNSCRLYEKQVKKLEEKSLKKKHND